MASIELIKISTIFFFLIKRRWNHADATSIIANMNFFCSDPLNFTYASRFFFLTQTPSRLQLQICQVGFFSWHNPFNADASSYLWLVLMHLHTVLMHYDNQIHSQWKEKLSNKIDKTPNLHLQILTVQKSLISKHLHMGQIKLGHTKTYCNLISTLSIPQES